MYTVYTDEGCKTAAKDTDGNTAKLTTKADGTTNTLELEPDDYYVKETTAATGYQLNNTVVPVTVTSDNTAEAPYTLKVTDTPETGHGTVVKSDANTTITAGNACYDLAGAEYTFYTDSACSTVAKTASGADAVLTTDSNGNTDVLELPLGTYYVKETAAATGYYLCAGTNACSNSKDGVHTVTVKAGETATVNCTDIPGNDPAGISLYKLDAGSGLSVSQGDASLEGAEFTVSYYDGYYYGDDDTDTSNLPDEATRTWVLQTVYNEYSDSYVADLADEDCFVSGDDFYYERGMVTLPLGTYTIQETKAPTGYLLEGADANPQNWVAEHTYEAPVHVGQVTMYDNTVGSLTIGNEYEVDDTVMRFDISLEKHDGETQEAIGSVEFMLTSLTTGESHCFYTDEHGNFTSDADVNPHTYCTNEAADQHSGLWFYGTADEADGTPVSDDLGALPFDSYRLDEIEGENNSGYEMAHMTFTVTDNDYAGEVIDLGLINNYAPDLSTPEPYLHSQAWAGDTGTQLCYAGDGWVTLYDNVFYYNLTPGETYYIYGIAYDVDTGEPETDHYGNVISAITEFTADESGSGMEVQEFYFDVEDLSGHRAVFYETIYMPDEDGEDYLEGVGNVTFVAAEDPEDYPNQTIYFPQVGTTLVDAEDGDHYSIADGVITLVDTVEIVEVPAGTDVAISGTLISKDTGEAIVDADGNPVTAGTTYTSTGLESQYVEIEFTFDASQLGESGVVAYEDLYQVLDTDTDDNGNGVLVGRHADIDDEGQTVNFPTIHTEATDANTGTHTSNASTDTTIIDEVEYSGLTPGEEYTMTGTLMDQSTEEPIIMHGDPVTSSVTFVPETSDGVIEMEFNFDSSLMAGSTIVVFEDLYQNGQKVATHSDITDVAQSVNIPEIGTTATDAEDGDHTVAAGDVTINDEVSYSGLEPGRSYTMVGTLMDKETGEAVTVDGEAVTAQVEFVPTESSGTVTVPITVNTADLAGHDLVVFEKAYELNDEGIYVEVGSHEDLNDEGQTIYVAIPETPETPTETPTYTQTGESRTGLFVGIIGCIAAALVAVAVVVRRRRVA